MKNSLLLIFIVFVLFVQAQKNIVYQNIYWLRYYNQLKIGKKFILHNEFENRTFFIKNKQHHFITHARLHYKISDNYDAALGLTYSLQSPHDPLLNSKLIIPEIRPVAEINVINPLSKRFALQQRHRIDARFSQKTKNNILVAGYDYLTRFRIRMQLSFKLNKLESKYPTVLKIADELMVNFGELVTYNYFDQNRIMLSIEQTLSKNIGLELSYIHWYQQRSSGFQFYEREIIRLTLQTKLNLKNNHPST